MTFKYPTFFLIIVLLNLLKHYRYHHVSSPTGCASCNQGKDVPLEVIEVSSPTGCASCNVDGETSLLMLDDSFVPSGERKLQLVISIFQICVMLFRPLWGV